MVRKFVSALALFAALSGSAVAKDPEPEVLKQTGKWVVEYDRDACHVYAEFGTSPEQVVLRFTRYAPGDQFHLTVFGSRVKTTQVYGEVKVDFGLKGTPDTAWVLTGSAGTMPALFFRSIRFDGWKSKSREDVEPEISPETEARVSGVTIAMQGKPPFRLASGSLGKPFGVMRHCLNNLVRSWGYDPDVQARASRKVTPIGSPANWIKDSDYPEVALREGQGGIVQFRLDVDPEGKILDCYVLDRTEPDRFAALTCKALRRRAKFKPALDADQKPIRSYFVSSVSFVVPE